MDNDPVFALYGRSQADVIAMLGPPSSNNAMTWGDATLCWYFPNSDVKLNSDRWPTQKAMIAVFVTLIGSNQPSHVSELRVLW